MTTAADIIKFAAHKSGVTGINQTVSGQDQAEILDLLNDMLAMLKDETGGAFDLGTLTAGNTVYLSAGDILSIKYSLAKLASEHYQLPMNQAFYITERDLKETLLSKYLDNEEVDMPRALHPQGDYLYDITSN